MDMFFEMEPTPVRKLPTLRQWLKENPEVKLKGKYLVTFIWLPNDYPNLTFQTEYFRVLVDEDHPSFDKCRMLVDTVLKDDLAFAISVSPAKDGGYSFTSSGDKGHWDGITLTGFKFVHKGSPKAR